MIASTSSTTVKAAARVIPIVYGGVAYPSGLVRSLAAKLTRVDSLVDSDRDSELDKVVHDLKQALVYALLAGDQHVDTLLANYYQGASSAGEARIAGVYASLLRLPGNRFQSVDVGSDLRPYGTALRRILTWASTTRNQDVIQEVHEALRHFPEQLAPVACEQMEFLLRELLHWWIGRLPDYMSSPVPAEAANDFLAHMERSNQTQRLAGLRAILEWASSAAAANPAAEGKFIGFIASHAQWPEHSQRPRQGAAAADAHRGIDERSPSIPVWRHGRGVRAGADGNCEGAAGVAWLARV